MQIKLLFTYFRDTRIRNKSFDNLNNLKIKGFNNESELTQTLLHCTEPRRGRVQIILLSSAH